MLPDLFDNPNKIYYNTRTKQHASGAAMSQSSVKAKHHTMLREGAKPALDGCFLDHHTQGAYVCRQCDAVLFALAVKFGSNTKWPNFDKTLPCTVCEHPDADGQRNEIACAVYDKHSRVVFRDETITISRAFPCPNSVSFDFVSEENRCASNP